MTKCFSRLVLCLCSLTLVFLFAAQTAFGQTEKLGIVTYTPPPGWTKSQTQPSVVAFSKVNNATGEFCMITLHGETASTGNPKSDFAREWTNLVIQNMKADANPTTETEVDDGWTAVAGGGAVEFSNNKALALLTVYSGFGKTVSVLGVLNDQTCIAQLTAFASALDIDKTAAAAPAVQLNRPTAQKQDTRPSRASRQLWFDDLRLACRLERTAIS